MVRPARKALAVTALCALLAPGTAAATARSTEPPTEPAPRTGFERSGGHDWTTLAEEADFLHTIDRQSQRVTVRRIGTTVGNNSGNRATEAADARSRGHPLRLVSMGNPAGNTALFLCSQHGDEPSGREACLNRIRDLAYDDSPQVQRMLATTELLFVPNANPDGHAAQQRENGQGIDINRDHLALKSPEARAVARVLRDRQPDVVHDLHEYGATPPYYDRDLLALWPRNLNTDEDVHKLSRGLSDDYVRPDVESNGFSTGRYGIWTDPETGDPIKQVAGSGQERILRNTAGVKNAMGLLVEARQEPMSDAERADPGLNHWRRVRSHQSAVSATLRMLRERGPDIARATEHARLKGTHTTGPVYFGGADNEQPPPAEVDTDPPRGYRLSAAQYDDIGDELRLHGVRSVPTPDGGRYVPLRQPRRALVPLLLDKRAEHNLVS